ncbi:hypothetical protein II654_01525, partial [bacterium]|nr:hypothetical protein [bacterium]
NPEKEEENHDEKLGGKKGEEKDLIVDNDVKNKVGDEQNDDEKNKIDKKLLDANNLENEDTKINNGGEILKEDDVIKENKNVVPPNKENEIKKTIVNSLEGY